MVVRSSATGGGERGRRRRKGRGHADHAVLAPKPDFGVPFAYIKTVSDEWNEAGKWYEVRNQSRLKCIMWC
jgi:hypothetical protein